MPAIGPKPKEANFNAPARPLTGFLLFSNTHRPKVIEELKAEAQKVGKSFDIRQVAGKITALWNELDAEKKEEVNAEAKKGKPEWEIKRQEWEKTADYKSFLEAKRTYERKVESKKLRKNLLAAGCPKKPASAYFLFTSTRREAVSAQLKAEGQKPSLASVAKIVTAEWNALSEEKKKTFTDEAIELKRKYDLEMEEYKKTDDHKNYVLKVANVQTKSANKQKVINSIGKEPKVPKEKKPRKQREPQLDADGNPIPKKPRAPRTKKASIATEATASTPVPMDTESAAEPAPAE